MMNAFRSFTMFSPLMETMNRPSLTSAAIAIKDNATSVCGRAVGAIISILALRGACNTAFIRRA